MDENIVKRQSVFSDSVLCLGVHDQITLGKTHLSGSKYRELDRIDGEPVVFERENFPGHTTLQLLRREIHRTNKENCMSSSLSVAAHAKRFPKGHRSFLRPGTEEQWFGTHTLKPNGSWDHVADLMMVS